MYQQGRSLFRPGWSGKAWLVEILKINRLKQTIVDKSVHFVNFCLRNFKRQMKILKNYIWTYENGLHPGRYDSERGKSLNDPKDLNLFPKIYFSISPINIESFCFIICISFHMLEPKTNYQLFKVIIGFGYKEATATITGSQDHAMLHTYLNLNMLWSDPRNKNVEKWSSQLKFEITDF